MTEKPAADMSMPIEELVVGPVWQIGFVGTGEGDHKIIVLQFRHPRHGMLCFQVKSSDIDEIVQGLEAARQAVAPTTFQ